jgi:hypothetical protein
VPKLVIRFLTSAVLDTQDDFGYTNAIPSPEDPRSQTGGFLSQLDSQQLLTYDNMTVPGAYSDNDMLECCNGKQTAAEYRSQFSTFAIQVRQVARGG